MIKNLIVIFILIFLSLTKGQTIRVFSKDDSIPIPSSHIIIKDLKKGNETFTVTNNVGIAKLDELQYPNSNYFITVSFIGYKKISDTIYKNQNKTYYLLPEKAVLNEVVVTGQYAPNSPEKAVHKIKIIDSKKIEAMGAVNLKDVLTNELNIRLSQDNILGSSMSLQGISGQNVKILLDGVPITGRLNGNIDLSQINMNNVERIEIIEGPLSVTYGTDALGGTINIITKKSQKEMFSISSNNYYESIGQYNSTGKIGFRKNKNLITLAGGRNYFDGWRTNDQPFYIEQIRIADSLRYKNWKPKEQFFGTLNYGHYFNKLKLGYTGDYFYEQVTNKGIPRAPYNETAFDDYYKTNRISNSLNLNGQLNKKYHLNLIAAYNHFKRNKNTYYNDLTTLNKILTINNGDQDTSTFNNIITRGTISSTKDTAKLNYEVGYDINYETALGSQIKNSKQNIGDYAIFTTAEYKPISGLIVRPGLRIIYNTSYKAPLVPSLNIKYSVSLNSKTNQSIAIRFSYARGFRSPSLKELYFYFVDVNHNITGNENLKAEQSHNFNLSTSFIQTQNEKVYKLELSTFYNTIDNMISLAQSSTTQFSYFNVENYKTMGAQLQNEFGIKHFKLTIGCAYVGRYNQITSTQLTETFLFSPEGRCNLFYEWHKHNITFGLFYKYTGKLPSYALTTSNDITKNIIQDYHTADCSISKSFCKKKFNVSLGAKNLMNVINVNGITTGGAHSSGGNSVSVGMGRTYFVKLDINLNTKN